MTRTKAMLTALFLGLFTAAGIQSAPGLVATGEAATNCSTLPSRITSLSSEGNNYNAQVGAINARGGGSASQKVYYDGWRARLINRGNALRAELSRCQSRGELRNVAPPTGPGGSPGTGRKPRSAQPHNPTPGFPAPEKYGRGSGVTSDRTTVGGGRTVIFVGGGRADFSALRGGRAAGVNARITRSMLDKGTWATPIRPRGLGGPRTSRGILLGKPLGGRAGDARNIVALTPRADAALRGVQNQVRNAAARCRPGQQVQYNVTPVYGDGPLAVAGNSPYPKSLAVSARGCGLNIGRSIPNR